MVLQRYLLFALCVVSSVVGATRLVAAGGSSVIATKGRPVSAQASWPSGVGELVNDAVRTSGWNSWFSEWPNDVNQYAFEAKTTDDVNRLIERLASIESDVCQIRLSHLKEPNALGWMTRLDEGNDVSVVFSIGDQARVDDWYKRVRKPFGVMEFVAAPVAVPPTLTVFVQNRAVNLDELAIPSGIDVAHGYVPTVFHRFNTKKEREREVEDAREREAVLAERAAANLDPASQAAVARIARFLKQRGASKER